MKNKVFGLEFGLYFFPFEVRIVYLRRGKRPTKRKSEISYETKKNWASPKFGLKLLETEQGKSRLILYSYRG